MNKICVVFNNAAPYTTGHFVLNACKKLGLNTIYAHPNLDKEDADLYIHVDSGHEDQVTTPKEKTVFYAIDSYQLGLGMQNFQSVRFDWWNYVKDRSKVFVDAFYQGRDWFASVGIKSHFIEMGIDEDMYYYEPREKKYDVCFVGGRKNDGERKKILDVVRNNFNLHDPYTWGHGLRQAACESKCFLDIPPMENDMLGQRFFEGYACQVPIVSMERPVLNPYKNDKAIFVFQKGNEGSIINAVRQGIAYTDLINRNIESMKWTNKVKQILEIYKNS